eukprot:TRINITY_DN1632_c0_g1_i2.p1 TRINITY_DN1632_c0_g1~~TRINITY_DN1632_c0_g1_i2.p1  ORF type:complete len:430 (+),score=103.19 TRINITY_DN1632_c0_g1_i2:49-1338(+)
MAAGGGDGNIWVAVPVITPPALAMLIGSLSVLVVRVPDRIQACFQMFSAGLLISAVAGELFPLLKSGQATDPEQPQATDFTSYFSLIAGFTVGLLFMFGLDKVTEQLEDDEDDDHEQRPSLEESRSRMGTTQSDLEVALLTKSSSKDEMEATLIAFRDVAGEASADVDRLEKAIAGGSRNQIDELLHRLEYLADRGSRTLTMESSLDAHNLKRMQYHCNELKRDAEGMQSPASLLVAQSSLKAFRGTLQHLHSHAERREKFSRWRPQQEHRPTDEKDAGKSLPLALIGAVVIDSAVDGLLIGLSLSASESAGWAMALATSIEMGFLGLSFCASLRTRLSSSLKLVAVAVVPPLTILLMGACGYLLGNVLSENPAIFVSFIAFSIVALLFLVTQELLVEAKELAGESVLVNSMFFIGLMGGILLEKVLDG